jgi:hypothetical protein
VFFDDNAVGIAAIGDASKVHVRRVVSKGHVWAELLKTVLALRAVAVGVNQATYCSKVAGLKLGDCGADLGDTANNLMILEQHFIVDQINSNPFLANST